MYILKVTTLWFSPVRGYFKYLTHATIEGSLSCKIYKIIRIKEVKEQNIVQKSRGERGKTVDFRKGQR